MNGHHPSHAWTLYWLIWFGVSFGAFLGPEIYALVTNARNTLSNAVWSFEELVPRQSISYWHAGHLLFTGMFILISVWLIFHFGWGLFR